MGKFKIQQHVIFPFLTAPVTILGAGHTTDPTCGNICCDHLHCPHADPPCWLFHCVSGFGLFQWIFSCSALYFNGVLFWCTILPALSSGEFWLWRTLTLEDHSSYFKWSGNFAIILFIHYTWCFAKRLFCYFYFPQFLETIFCWVSEETEVWDSSHPYLLIMFEVVKVHEICG